MKKPPAYRVVLAAVDLSAVSSSVIAHAAGLAGCHGGRVEVLAVCEDLVAAAALWGRLPEFTRGVQKDAQVRTGERLRALIAGVQAPGVDVRAVVRTGIASEVVLRHARKIRADAIVLGRHGYTRLEKILVGSTAERVAGQASCPVLLVPAPKPPTRRIR